MGREAGEPTTVLASTCEVRTAERWEETSIDEVLAMQTRPDMRCVECHGRVRAHREANNGMAAHFEHLEAHRGCSRSSAFDGSHSTHPSPLE